MLKCPNALCGRTDDDIGKCGNFALCPKQAVPIEAGDVVLHCGVCEVTRVVPAGRIMQNKGLDGHSCLQADCAATAITLSGEPVAQITAEEDTAKSEDELYRMTHAIDGQDEAPELTAQNVQDAAVLIGEQEIEPAKGTLAKPSQPQPASKGAKGGKQKDA